MDNIKIIKVSYDFLSQYKALLLEESVLLDPSTYKNGVEDPTSEHTYFFAISQGRPAGISVMAKYTNTNDNTIKIYHRAAYTFPDFRKQGVWAALMLEKVKYCYKNSLNESDNTTHHVSCDLTDSRYRNMGWNLHAAYEVNINNKKLYHATWYSTWGKIKKFYKI